MKIVVDTNRIIAALVKDSTTRTILFDKSFKFLTSDYAITEIQEHKDELKAKTNLNDEEFEILLALIFEHIGVIPKSIYENHMEDYKNEISDLDDIPVLATAIATEADGIWAHDPHFEQQKKVKVFRNIDLLKLSEKNKFE